ncbi:MAG: YraN family protein [Verrucomicrobiota bacterium]|nr:YraN family protein [Verrucomicrobiota bacterium]
MPWTTKQLGDRGEELAARYLEKKGYKILVRQWRARNGEIDLICRHGEQLVFVEVKARSDETFNLARHAVTSSKERNVAQSGMEYLRKLGSPDLVFRFDIVEVNTEEPQYPQFRHIERAFGLPVGSQYLPLSHEV